MARRVESPESGGWPKQPTVPLVQAIVHLPTDYPPGTVRVWFVPDDTPYFYWLIPESPTRGALGLIGEDGAATRRALDRFLEKKHFEPLAYQGARIPVYHRWVPVKRTVGEGDVYLVGDAAGQVKVTTVGGIVTGLRGAAGAAEAILNGGHSKILKRLRRELNTHLLIRRGLHRFQQADYSRLVDLLGVRARQLLSIHTRDEAARMLWNILRTEPRLALMGLRGVLMGGSIAPASDRQPVAPPVTIDTHRLKKMQRWRGRRLQSMGKVVRRANFRNWLRLRWACFRGLPVSYRAPCYMH